MIPVWKLWKARSDTGNRASGRLPGRPSQSNSQNRARGSRNAEQAGKMGRSAPSPAPSQMQGTEGFAIGEGFTVQAFKRYVSSVVFHGWKPQFVVLHHTVIPTIQQWHAMTGETATTRLSEFFKGRGWKGAYHVLIADDLVWLLTPLDRQGVHSPSWNRMSFGVSMIGNYD